MKKYICPNCGFVSRFNTSKVNIDNNRHKHICKTCKANVYKSEIVLESMIRMNILTEK